jgi:hypothetical protein
MDSIAAVQTRRREIAEELLAMRSMRRGNINEQYAKGKRAGKSVTRGPYPVLCWREGKRVLSERLTTGEELEHARQDVANHKRFKQLCKEFEVLTQRLGELERREDTHEATLKKGLKSRSNKAGK